jgi:MFS family permease
LLNRIADQFGINRTVLALSVARLGDAIGNSILFVVIPLFVAKLPAPIVQFPESVRVGILISLYGLVNSLLQPFMGAFSDQAGKRKPFIMGGLIVMAIGTLGFLVAVRFTDLLVLRAFQGLGVAVTVPAALALMAEASHKRTRGGSMGIYTTFRMLGLSIGPLLGGALLDSFGFNASFYAGAGFILIGVLLVQIWVRDVSVEKPPEKQKLRIIDPKLINAGIVAAGFATFVMAAAFTMMATLEKQFNTKLSISAFQFSLAFSSLLFSRLIFQVPLGRWSDHIGRKPLIIAGLILMAPATALLGIVTSNGQLIGVRLFQGLASAAIAAPVFAVAGDLSRKGGEGRQMSIVTMGFGLGIALGPLIAGALAVVSFELPFIIGAALSLLGALVVFIFIPETIQRGNEKEQE